MVAVVTGRVLETEACFVAFSHSPLGVRVKQVIVAELIHAVVVSGDRGQAEGDGGLAIPGFPSHPCSERGPDSLLNSLGSWVPRFPQGGIPPGRTGQVVLGEHPPKDSSLPPGQLPARASHGQSPLF